MSQVGGPTPPEGRVALLFTDVEGSTALLHRLGTAYGEVLDEHDRILRGVWEEFGGVEVDNEGDSFFVAFADHALAVAAVTAAHQRLATAAWPDGVQLRVRMALHSGEPAIRGRKYWGVDVHYAARLGSAAHGGQVLLSADMRAQVPELEVESLGSHGLKDFPAPRELFHLALDGARAADFPPPRTLAATRSNLPTIDTPIIGRDEVVADLVARLTGPARLVTLVGPGGIGKTRTAVAVGERLVDVFPDGVAFVSLAALRSATEVPAALVEALQSDVTPGADAETTLLALLRDRRRLVVLDNAEHLSGVPALVARLLELAPGPRWLVTSQAALGVRAETVLRLDPLGVSPGPEGAAGELEAVPSAALFLERVRSRSPDYTVSGADRGQLIDLCRLLEGIPLAIELAAARAPVVGLPRLVEAVDTDPLTALGPGPADLPERQRGLRAVLAWTLGLLEAREREVFAACAGFAQAWSIHQIERMCSETAGADGVWDALARLLDLSLIVQRGDGRFTMPERVRRHAVEELADSGRAFEVRSRHAQVITDDVQRLNVQRVCQWARANAELDDLTEEVLHALTWTSAHEREKYRCLLATARCVLHSHAKLSPFVDDIRGFARSEGPDDRARGVFLMSLTNPIAGSGTSLDDRLAASTAAEACFAEHGEIDDRLDLLVSVLDLRLEQGDFARARSELDQGVLRAWEAGRADWAQSLEDRHVDIDLAAGDIESAEARLRIIRADPLRDNSVSSGALTLLGDCAFARGDFRSAAGLYAEYLHGLPSADLVNVILQVYGIAAACAALGHDDQAAELWAASSSTYETRTGRPWSDMASEWEDELGEAGLRLPSLAWARAQARGRSLSYEAMVARALEVAQDIQGRESPTA